MPERPSSTNDSNAPPAAMDGGDLRLAFVYAEAVRGLQHQQGVVESLNTRAGNLIFATAFASSLLGGRALLDGVGPWDWLALTLLFLIGLLVAIMVWPYYNYTFRFDPEKLLQDFVDQHLPQPWTGCTERLRCASNPTWPAIGGSSNACASRCSLHCFCGCWISWPGCSRSPESRPRALAGVVRLYVFRKASI
ncbi:hypothetical protein [Mesorhizobium sp. M0185]|uniref:hypothetical protein n=1 Tax=unclassified Mesorhizobium TaxID=325217 RepID=UPI0033352A87